MYVYIYIYVQFIMSFGAPPTGDHLGVAHYFGVHPHKEISLISQVSTSTIALVTILSLYSNTLGPGQTL